MEFSVVGTLLISCICATYSIYNNKVTFRDVDLFSPCENQPENVLDIHGLFDFSNHHYEFNDNYEIVVSGNLTTVWDIQPTDRVKMTTNIFRFDRGSWMITQYLISVPDFCLVLFKKNDFWYEAWVKHLLNAEQIKNKCFSLGTTFMHETYALEMVIPSLESRVGGLYKSQTKLQAIGRSLEVRPTTICFEIVGEIEG